MILRSPRPGLAKYRVPQPKHFTKTLPRGHVVAQRLILEGLHDPSYRLPTRRKNP